MTTTIVRGGTIATDYGTFRADLVLRNGRIVALVDDADLLPRADEEIDARGLLVLPGGIDPHVHAEEPGATHRADFATETMNAAVAGITTIVEHPLSHPPTATAALLHEKVRLVEEKAYVDVALYGAVIPSSLSHLDDLHMAGASGFKAFMPRTPDYPRVDDAQLLTAMTTVAGFDGLVLVHAESDALIHGAVERLRAAGRHDPDAYLEAHAPLTEYEAVQRALTLAGAAGVRLQVVHVSVPEAATAVAEARRRGTRATMEVCVHHLLLDADDFRRHPTLAFCAPPLRERPLVEKLWRHVLDGTVDCIVSDQSTATREEKAAIERSVWEGPPGIQSLHLAYPLFFGAAVQRRGLGLPAFVRLTATNAARAVGLYPRKGTILPGSDADLVFYDPEAHWVADAAASFCRDPWSPLHGLSGHGRVVRTIVRGTTVSLHGEIVGQRGYGRFLPGRGASITALPSTLGQA